MSTVNVTFGIMQWILSRLDTTISLYWCDKWNNHKKITNKKENQHPLPVETDWLREQNHDAFLLSLWEDDRLKPEPEHLANWFLKFLLTVQGTNEGLTSEAPKQRLEFILRDENLWQLNERNDLEGEDFDPREVVGLQNGVVISVVSPKTSLEHVQNVRDRFVVLWISLGSGLVSGSFTNVTMPCRHRGHAIEPAGPWVVLEAEFVEHKYKAHCVQNSWSQPVLYYHIICITSPH